MAAHSNIIAWEILGQRSCWATVHGLQRVRYDLATKQQQQQQQQQDSSALVQTTLWAAVSLGLFVSPYGTWDKRKNANMLIFMPF